MKGKRTLNKLRKALCLLNEVQSNVCKIYYDECSNLDKNKEINLLHSREIEGSIKVIRKNTPGLDDK